MFGGKIRHFSYLAVQCHITHNGAPTVVTIPLLFYVDGREVPKDEWDFEQIRAASQIAELRWDIGVSGMDLIPRVLDIYLDDYLPKEE